MNNYIADVPMRFSERYISTLLRNTLEENDDDDGGEEDFLARFRRKVDVRFDKML